MGARHCNRRTNVITTGIKVGEDLANHGSKRVERHDRVWPSPTRVWSKRCHRSRVGQVWTMAGLQGPAGYRQGTIDRVGTSVGANGITMMRLREGSNDRATLERVTVAPHNRAGVGARWPGMRSQDNVLLALLLVRH